ncbi:hypothetical protein [Aeromonas sobria]|uniref:hypothetical protein n=1 Tax=Aeromonas sobria TaxID=646 RepID=UPI0012FF0EC2|nr:hypothetical protein [Aeromonas sobria]
MKEKNKGPQKAHLHYLCREIAFRDLNMERSKRAGAAFGHPIGHRSFGSLTHADGVADSTLTIEYQLMLAHVNVTKAGCHA